MPIAVTLLLACLAASEALAAEYRAGVAAVDITPEEPIRLSGYGARDKPSEGILARLYAKALAIEDGRKTRIVIITTDLIGLPRSITDPVAARLGKERGLDRAALLFNSSHTHTGPYIRGNLPLLLDLNPAERDVVDRYADRLSEALFEVASKALDAMVPASIEAAHGAAHFAVNRREFVNGAVRIGVNPNGPVDPDVPILRITSNGKPIAILFGYACHNTTLTAPNNVISGDYAGFAQAAVERVHPGAIAMFLMLCGGDQNPNPRGTPELGRRYGEELAAEVNRVLDGRMQPLTGPLRCAFQMVELEFQPVSAEDYAARASDPNPSRARHARAMLKLIEEGRQIRRYAFPVQAIAFGRSLTIVALGGEDVIDYDLRIKREFRERNIIVAGYSNDVMAYIPSRRVLREGGYEAVDSMYGYGLPGPWAEDTEERIMAAVRQVVRRVGGG